MAEVTDESVHLVVTSPPYWHIKDYRAEGQIGYGQSLHEYLYDLSRVWRECYRVLKPGRRLCINIGDQFARGVEYGRYKVVPLHAEIVAQCETLGFDYMGAIIWQKKTTVKPTGGAVVMGSFPYPPNGVVELDYEFVLLFRKPGKSPPVPPEVKQASRLTRDEWKEYFTGHWIFGGKRQTEHEAMFPDELPRRLIRMFTFVGETVLDPFLGSGTTVKVAIALNRSAIGYEIQRAFEPVIRQKLEENAPVSFLYREVTLEPVYPPAGYAPHVQEMKPAGAFTPPDDMVSRVVAIVDEHTLQMEDGSQVRLLGITVPAEGREKAIDYLHRYVLGKRVVIKDRTVQAQNGAPVLAYVYLANRLFVNRKMIEMGLAKADRTASHCWQERFIRAERSVADKPL
ncbi:MAG: thermonuclease family protein [Chthonomonadetes bacterium]|nr:thermonuclease family protein [Chthonomonadetes bacterium]